MATITVWCASLPLQDDSEHRGAITNLKWAEAYATYISQIEGVRIVMIGNMQHRSRDSPYGQHASVCYICLAFNVWRIAYSDNPKEGMSNIFNLTHPHKRKSLNRKLDT